jgi:hypothetical protein
MKSAPAAVTDVILDLVLHAPATTERALQDPAVRAHKISRAAARKASLMSGSMSLPPGVLGWITVLPELVGVWRLQAQMVSDLSAVYGQRGNLGREQMLYCLFKHVSAQLLRDVVVRVGERVVVREASLKMLQSLAQQLGVHVTKAMLSRSASRFVPLLGAVGVGAYAYYDTMQVAKNAMELFGNGQGVETPKPLNPEQENA